MPASQLKYDRCQPAFLLRSLLLLALLALTACSGGGGGGGGGAGAAADSTVITVESAVSPDLDSFSATLSIENGADYTLTVTEENQLSVAVPDLPPGSYNVTVEYYSGEVFLGSSAEVILVDNSGSVSIPLQQSNFSSNNDDDADGWTNLAELLQGSDSQDPFSVPTETHKGFAINAGGVAAAQSSNFSLHDRIGSPISGGESSSASYSISGTF